MKLGIVGLPNVGKSTLFNAMTSGKAAAANYPFCTIDPNIGVVPVPDPRLDELTLIYKPEKTVPAIVEFLDIAGLVKGASKGEGLGNRFLSHIREVDGIVHVVRCFDNPEIIHVEGDVNPVRDIETIEYELMLSDIEIVLRRLEKVTKLAKADRKYNEHILILERLEQHLNDGKAAATFASNDLEAEILSDMPLLSNKKIIYAANMGEEDFSGNYRDNPRYKVIKAYAKERGASVIPVCAKLEQDISGMSKEEKQEFLRELNLDLSGLDRLVKASYSLLDLISFLTAGKPEVRAWTVKNGTKAPAAAGVIHSDFERGFIRAEVIDFDVFIAAGGSMVAAKEKGLMRSEGREYIMRDGDIVLFRFNI